MSASYPNGEVVFNISKATTRKELISIDGVSEHQRRMQGINLSGGPTNAAEFCQEIFSAPTFDVLCDRFLTNVNQPTSESLSTIEMRKQINAELGYVY